MVAESRSALFLGAHGSTTSPCRVTLGTAVSVHSLGAYMSGTEGKLRIKEEFLKLQNTLPGDVSLADKGEPTQKGVVLSGPPALDSEFAPLAGNFVEGYRRPQQYIAIKGPDSSTAGLFWNMVCRYNVNRIITLVMDSENSSRYWPDVCVPQKYDDVVVTLVNREIKAKWITRTFKVTKGSTGKDLHLTQHHFIVWPEGGVPLAPDAFKSFRDEIMASETENEDTSVIVHCSDGFGRTGMFLVLDYLLKEAQNEACVDVATCVETLRKQRAGLITTMEQYQCIYDTMYILAALVSPPVDGACCGKDVAAAGRGRSGNVYEDGLHENVYESIPERRRGSSNPGARITAASSDSVCKI